MKRTEMEKDLIKWKITGFEKLKWNEFISFYHKQKKIHEDNFLDEWKNRLNKYDKFIDDNYSEKSGLQKPDQIPKTERELLRVEIIELMAQLKGRTNGTRGEIDKMFRLYNKYFKRVDNPNCGSCVARVYEALKKII